MKAFLAMVFGAAALVVPLSFFPGMVPFPEYRTGTIADFAPAIIAAVTLYGGVFAGVFVHRSLLAQRPVVVSLRSTFAAGMAGAMIAITLAIIAHYLLELVTTGRLMPPGHTPALLPILYVLGGVVSALIAGGVALIAYALAASKP